MAKVTILLSSYNHEDYIEECICSILEQTYKDFNLFIVDDCSKDNSWSIIQKYARMDHRIKAIRHTYNWGRPGMRELLPSMDGEYLAIAHCDDKWESTKLEKQVNILTEKNVIACFTLVKVIDDYGMRLKNEKHPYYCIFNQPNRNRYEWLNYFFYNGNCLCHPSLVIKKNAYQQYGLFTKGLQGYPDFCQWIRLCMNQDIYIVQEELTCFRVHIDDSNTSGWNYESMKRISVEEYMVLQEFEKLLGTGDFVKVFPEAEKYIVNAEIVEKFALAKIMLKVPKSSYVLRGLELLYELFQEDKYELKIKELYNYTAKEFDLDKKKFDVFHIIGDEKKMHCTLYLDLGNGYQESAKVSQEVIISPSGYFRIEFDLSKIQEEIGSTIRLDLDEGKYRKFQNMKIICDEINLDFEAVNGIRDNEGDCFFTMDPQYEVNLNGKGKVIISGETELINSNKVMEYQKKYEEMENKFNRLERSAVIRIYRKIKKYTTGIVKEK